LREESFSLENYRRSDFAQGKTMKKRLGKRFAFSIVMAGLVVAALAARRMVSTSVAPSRQVQATRGIDKISFVGDGDVLMSSDTSGSGLVSFWNAETGKMSRRWRGGSNAEGGLQSWLSLDGRRMIEAAYDYKNKRARCVLRDATTGHVLRSWAENGRVADVSRDLKLMLVTENERAARLQELEPVMNFVD
jgi:hypothetical protein